MTENEENILAVTYEEKSKLMEFMDWVEEILDLFYLDIEEAIANIEAIDHEAPYLKDTVLPLLKKEIGK